MLGYWWIRSCKRRHTRKPNVCALWVVVLINMLMGCRSGLTGTRQCDYDKMENSTQGAVSRQVTI